MIDFILPKAKNDAQAQMSSALSSAGDTIQLNSGEASLFPTGYKGSATSLGSSVTLNSTGIGAKVAVGNFIRNITDGSIAWVTTVATDSVTTTKLMGGTDDTWESADEWVTGSFYAWLSKKDASGVDTTRELVLVEYVDSATDQIHIETRAVEGTATDFAADDYVSVYVSAQYPNQISLALAELMRRKVDSDDAVLKTGDQSVDGIKTFTSFPVLPSSAPSTDYQPATKKYVDDNSGGVSANTFMPVPLARMTSPSSNYLLTGNATGWFHLFNLPVSITVNKVSFYIGSGSLASPITFKIYSEDGSNVHVSETTATPTANSNFTHTLSVPVDLLPGVYIFAFSYTASGANQRAYHAQIGTNNANNTPGEPLYAYTEAVTAGALPATTDPTAGTGYGYAVNFRID